MSAFSSEFKAKKLNKNRYLIEDGFCFSFCWSKSFGEEGRGQMCLISVLPGAVTDFASVPKPLDKWFPRKGKKVAKAAVIHDLLYQFNVFSRKICDKIFVLGLFYLKLAPWKRMLMYRAVRLFGWAPYHRYKCRLSRGCAPLDYYTIADQPIIVEWYDRFYDLLEAIHYFETKVLRSRV